MLHVALHLLVPLGVARLFHRARWRSATLWMLATMLVDIDHLLADPIYDPARCSIGFHPLHTAPAIALYSALFAIPLIASRGHGVQGAARVTQLLGLGLLLHMALDWGDCLL